MVRTKQSQQSSHRRRRRSGVSTDNNNNAVASSPPMSFLQSLELLRNFVGSEWQEADLSDCLRLCGCNAQAAAEKLMTGQYQRQPRNTPSGSAFFRLHQRKPQGKEKSAPASGGVVQKEPPTTKRPRSLVSLPVGQEQSKKGKPSVVPEKPLSSSKIQSSSSPSSSTPSLLLLCERWIVATCTTFKRASVAHREPLVLTGALTGPPVVRFQGQKAAGTLPANLGTILAPLLKQSCIVLQAETLMEDCHVAVGGEVPIVLRVFLSDKDAFFGLFSSPLSSSTLAASLQQQQRQNNNSNNNKALTTTARKRKKNVDNCDLAESAFALLQWAQYGDDAPDFGKPAAKEALLKTESDNPCGNHHDNTEEDDNRLWDEQELEQGNNNHNDDTTNPETVAWAQDVVGPPLALPEANTPAGFVGNIQLRPYQKQALHWLVQREQPQQDHTVQQDEWKLLSELTHNGVFLQTGNSNCLDNTLPTIPLGPQEKDVWCDCGPVRVSSAAANKAVALDGTSTDPALDHHPLWQRRFVSTPQQDALAFYVNEFTQTASAGPPPPPHACRGGILADAMGLGKTVMLLALLLRDDDPKESMPNAKTTLVVAPLSLLSQWQEEIATKTNLTHKLYYAESARNPVYPGSFRGIHVVLTTYGTLQGEMHTVKSSSTTTTNNNTTGLLSYPWHRVILDEAHCIKNPTTLVSRACCALQAERRWCVTGTPIQNSLQDIYALLKFLRHEPWSESAFWKTAITNCGKQLKAKSSTVAAASLPTMDTDQREQQQQEEQDQQKGMDLALSRVRRIVTPLILRRTKESCDENGNPILTLPPVESKIIRVELSPAEREFYDALKERSQAIFEGYLEAGTVSKSWFAIFSLLHRLRMTCDHVALTVRAHMAESDWKEGTLQGKRNAIQNEHVGMNQQNGKDVSQEFLQSLLSKFREQHRQKKAAMMSSDDDSNDDARKHGGTIDKIKSSQSSSHQDTDMTYETSVAMCLSQAVENNAETIDEECPICLDPLSVKESVITPCAHLFCKNCLIDHLRENAPNSQLDIPDGLCPVCNVPIVASRIISMSQSETGRASTVYLRNDKSPRVGASPSKSISIKARGTLEHALSGAQSSKLAAILQELDNVWEADPGSKVLIFSQFLGFLDLLSTAMDQANIVHRRLDGKLSWKDRVTVLNEFKDERVSTIHVGTSGTSAAAAAATNRPTTNDGTESSTTNTLRRGSVLLISMRAGGVGINLVAASTVFIVDPWWNAAVEDQCINRIHRIGQTAQVVRVRKFVVTDSVEERMVQLQGRKKQVAGQILSDGANGENNGFGKDGSNPSVNDFKVIFGNNLD